MAIKHVLRMGSKQLATPSTPLEDFAHLGSSYPGFEQLINDMLNTMQHQGGVGIAAPQIGINKRVIMFGFEKNLRYPGQISVPFTILVNPVIKFLTDEMVDDWEGCLSVPGLRGLVPRYSKLEYRGFDHQGQEIRRIAEGFHARIVQHEYDHLDGILYPQRLKDLRFFGFEDELAS